MRNRRIAKSAVILLLSAAAGLGICSNPPAAQAGPDARGIMDKVALTRKLAGSEAVVKMSIINAKGQARERKLTMATKLYDGGKTEKRIYRFLSPSDVKGTGVLVFDYESKADDMWVFLPALRKTRRIVSSQRSKSFMGSEFSYGDLNIPSLDEYNYSVLKEESYGGDSCWVIQVLPKNKSIADEEGYSKKIYWISKDKFTLRKGEYYDLDGKLLKEMKTDNVKLLDSANKRYRAMKMEMVNKQNGRRSLFESEQVSFTPSTKDEFFTPRYLERQ